MSLPTPESLLPGLAAVESALAVLEARLLLNPYGATDGTITAVADGTVQLSSLDLPDTQLALGATALASKVLPLCAQALAAAAAGSAPTASQAASGYTLPGIPSPS